MTPPIRIADADARAQTLSVSDFVGLANRVVERAEKP